MGLKTSIFKKIGGLRTLIGGVQPATVGGSSKVITFPALGSLTGGTDTAGVAGTRFSASVLIPHNMVLTGIGFLIGSVGGTDKALVELHDANGTLIASSAAAGVTVGTTGTFQQIPFAAPVEVTGPCWYYLSVTTNGNTAKLRTIPTALGISQTALTKSATGTFGTVGDLTVPTTFTADVGPIAYTY